MAAVPPPAWIPPRFQLNPAAEPAWIEAAARDLGIPGFAGSVRSFYLTGNGGAGWIGERWCEIWPVEEIFQRNFDYRVSAIAPELILLGGDGVFAWGVDRATGGQVIQEVEFAALHTGGRPVATLMREWFAVMAEDLRGGPPAEPQPPFAELVRRWEERNWQICCFTHRCEVFHLLAFQPYSRPLRVGWIACGDPPGFRIGSGAASVLVAAFARAIRDTGSPAIRFLGADGERQSVPPPVVTLARKVCGFDLADPHLAGSIPAAQAALLFSRLSGFSAEAVDRLERRNVGEYRAGMMVARNLWGSGDVDLLSTTLAPQRHVFHGASHPEHGLAYAADLQAQRLALMGVLADIHGGVAGPGSWAYTPNIRRLRLAGATALACLSPRSLGDGLYHWPSDIRNFDALPATEPKRLVVCSDFTRAPQAERLAAESLAAAAGIAIHTLPVSAADLDARIRRGLRSAADYEEATPEPRA